MIPKKYTPLVFAFFMALCMSCVMSFAITLLNLGLVDNLLQIWLHSWSVAFMVSYPIVLTVSPMVRRLVALVIKD